MSRRRITFLVAAAYAFVSFVHIQTARAQNEPQYVVENTRRATRMAPVQTENKVSSSVPVCG
jgi:hypothetical protein